MSGQKATSSQVGEDIDCVQDPSHTLERMFVDVVQGGRVADGQRPVLPSVVR
jgi:hypothetical protein